MFIKFKTLATISEFGGGRLGIFFNPFYFARRGLYQNISELSKSIKGKVLDVGCGIKPYEKIFKTTRYIGLEIDTPLNRRYKKADYFYDGITFPFEDETFDSVVSFQVFEHVFNPSEFLKEVHRVLRMNGYLLISVPFVWDEHEQPYDYGRYSSYGLKSILDNNGFKIIMKRKSINDIRVIFQLINCYIYKVVMKYNSDNLSMFFRIFLFFPANLLGSLLYKFMPKNDDLYLDNIILAKKVK